MLIGRKFIFVFRRTREIESQENLNFKSVVVGKAVQTVHETFEAHFRSPSSHLTFGDIFTVLKAP